MVISGTGGWLFDLVFSENISASRPRRIVLLLLSVAWLSDFVVSTWVCLEDEVLCGTSGEAGLMVECGVDSCDWIRFVLECLSDVDDFDNVRSLSSL